MTKKANQRKQKRHQCVVPIEADPSSAFAGAKTIDISREGLGLISTSKVRPKQKIAVQLDLSPEGDSVLAVGRVKWVQVVTDNNVYRFGLHLEELRPGSKGKLNKRLSKS